MRHPRLRTFPVYFEGLLRPPFSSLISSSFLKCSRVSELTVTAHQGHTLISSNCDEVTVTAGIGHIM